MNSRLVLPIALWIALVPARASEEPAAPESKPGLASKILKPWTFFKRTPEPKPAAGDANWKRLTLTTSLEPMPLKLSETRAIKVTMRLANNGKRFTQLEFPTTQRIEVLVRDAAGKMVEQWSEDQSFAAETTLVAVNPGERLEYSVSVSTRELAAGQRYSIEAYFPNYEQLKSIKTLVPEK